MSRQCKICKTTLSRTFIDLGMSPMANSYLSQSDLIDGEMYYPLKVYICEHCLLVQLEEFKSPKAIFSNYSYFSSFSDTWLEHCKSYAEMMLSRFEYGPNSQIIEVASNDGYLLKYFQSAGIPLLGIEPASNIAEVAIRNGIPTITQFWGRSLAESLAKEGILADLIIGNNVLAHVPDVHDFVSGLKLALKPNGVITMEFPHLLKLIKENQFDTIYHEHFSYFSFMVVQKLFQKHGLEIFDVDELPTHGGSLRIYARHLQDSSKRIRNSVKELIRREIEAKLNELSTYNDFAVRVKKIKLSVLELFNHLSNQGKTIVGYGAPAKGNTFLNYCSIGREFLKFTTDRSPYKQGKFLPGTHIPILAPEEIAKFKPDYIFILPWNLQHEITQELNYIRKWNGKFIVSIPEMRVF